MAHGLLSSLHSYLGDARDMTDTKLCPLSHTQVPSRLMPKNRTMGTQPDICLLRHKEGALGVLGTPGKF